MAGKGRCKGPLSRWPPYISTAPRWYGHGAQRAPGLHRAVPGQPHLRQVPPRERLGLQPVLLRPEQEQEQEQVRSPGNGKGCRGTAACLPLTLFPPGTPLRSDHCW